MEGKQPFGKIKISNNVEICFWVDETESNNKMIKMLKPQITKGWKDKEGKWENRTISLSMNDLYRLIVTGHEIKKIEDRFKNELKIADEN